MSATGRHAPQGFHTVTPYLIVNNAPAAIDFYGRAFGAVELEVNKNENGKVLHAEVSIGDSPVMLAEECEFNGIVAKSPHGLGGISMQLYLYVPDVDGLFARALSAGAKEVMPVADRPVRGSLGRRRGPIRSRVVAGDISVGSDVASTWVMLPQRLGSRPIWAHLRP